jgi:hypothetical protein
MEEKSLRYYFKDPFLSASVLLLVLLVIVLLHKLVDEQSMQYIERAIVLIASLVIIPIIVISVVVYFATKVKFDSIITELTKRTDDVAHNFEICNLNSPLAQLLLNKGDICYLEKQTSSEVYIITRNLKFDEDDQVKTVVANNLYLGIRYSYLLKDGTCSVADINNYKNILVTAIAALNRTEKTPKRGNTGQSAQVIVNDKTHFAHVPEMVFNFLTDIVVYNPGKEDGTCRGYVVLPKPENEILPRGIRAILITNQNSLKDLVRSIRAMKDIHNDLCIPNE